MKILLAHRLRIEREAIACLLLAAGFNPVHQVAEFNDLESSLSHFAPDILILDFDFCGLGDDSLLLKWVARCTQVFPAVKLIILGSSFRQTDHLKSHLSAIGVRSYLPKSESSAALVQALKHVAAGGAYRMSAIDDDASTQQLLEESDAQKLGLLSRRQKDVLALIARGFTTKQMALELNVGVKTIESHRAKLMHRLDIHHIAGLVKFALRTGVALDVEH